MLGEGPRNSSTAVNQGLLFLYDWSGEASHDFSLQFWNTDEAIDSNTHQDDFD